MHSPELHLLGVNDSYIVQTGDDTLGEVLSQVLLSFLSLIK